MDDDVTISSLGADDDDDFTPPIDLGGSGSEDFGTVSTDPAHLHAAIAEAAARAHYDPASDDLTPGFVNDIQGIAGEYLMADALNQSHDGLTYRLFADPTHPDVDVAGFDAQGNSIRLLQVKATQSPWYSRSALKPGLEVITSSDSWSDGLLRYDLTSTELRDLVEGQLQ